jgi:uncharacterized protein YacL
LRSYLAQPLAQWIFIATCSVLVGIIAYAVAPRLMQVVDRMMSWFETALQKTPIQDLLGGAIGLIVGLIIASLLGATLAQIPFIGAYLPTLGSLLFGYLGLTVGVKKKEELVAIFSVFRFGKEKDRAHRGEQANATIRPNCKILDTSVIIDGRIADIFQTGFIEGVVVIPGFVLEELRHVADSSDVLKRNRGRRGLDILNKIQKETTVPVEFPDWDTDEVAEVDDKLVKMAQHFKGLIITNDFNLNKVAELKGVRVLNINDLANAVKPVVLPGEEMVVSVIKDGKEAGQGIGYLDDGTMIVVDGGRRYIGQNIGVLVTSVLQTSAGRMIFAKPKAPEKKMSASQRSLNEVNAIG